MLTKIKALHDANKINQHWEDRSIQDSREASAATEECLLTVFIRYFNGPSCEEDITAEADRGEKGAYRIHQWALQFQKQTVILVQWFVKKMLLSDLFILLKIPGKELN